MHKPICSQSAYSNIQTPHFLREVSAILVIAVYIPTQADAMSALGELHGLINTHPVAGDFNHADLKHCYPGSIKMYAFKSREKNILDQVCTNILGACKAAPFPYLGSSDHISLMTLSYKSVVCRTRPAERTVQVSSECCNTTQDCIEITAWGCFHRELT